MERGSWDDPRARATRGLRRPSLDARSWDHPSHPLVIGGKGSLAAALPVERHVLACRGWAGENNGQFEHPARDVAMRRKRSNCWELFLRKDGVATGARKIQNIMRRLW